MQTLNARCLHLPWSNENVRDELAYDISFAVGEPCTAPVFEEIIWCPDTWEQDKLLGRGIWKLLLPH